MYLYPGLNQGSKELLLVLFLAEYVEYFYSKGIDICIALHISYGKCPSLLPKKITLP